MPKKRLQTIMNEVKTDFDFDQCLQICKDKLEPSMLSGKGKNTWISEEGQELLNVALIVPEIVPKHHKGRVIRLAPNPSYVYAKVQEIEKVIPVVVPRRMQKTFLGKSILIEEIADKVGSSFRYIREKLFNA